MKKTRFCPKCNLKMRKVTIKGVTNATASNGGFGMFSYFKPINLGGNVEYSQKVLMCPKCSRQIPIVKKERSKATKAKKATGKKGTFWKVLLALLIIVIVVAVVAVVLYKTGNMPQNIIDFVKSIMPDSVMEFLKTYLA